MLKDTSQMGFVLHTGSRYVNVKADYAKMRPNGALVFLVQSGVWKREVAYFSPGSWSACHLIEGFDGGRNIDADRIAAGLKAES